jgi:hypothetical protein
VTVNFGFPTTNEGDTATVTVSAPTVASNSKIFCSPATVATADHDPDDIVVEAITAYGTNIVPGVSFDVVAVAPQNSWGRYVINAQFT